MSVFSYVVVHDNGFAPNPYPPTLTLATCKPAIRRVAQPNDWLLGTASSRHHPSAQVIFAAQVGEVLPLERYAIDSRFAIKRPASRPPTSRSGDNIYFRDSGGAWCQRRNPFHGPSHMARDLGGVNVLVASRYLYFGSAGPLLPEALHSLVKRGPGHKRVSDILDVSAFEAWFREQTPPGKGPGTA